MGGWVGGWVGKLSTCCCCSLSFWTRPCSLFLGGEGGWVGGWVGGLRRMKLMPLVREAGGGEEEEEEEEEEREEGRGA